MKNYIIKNRALLLIIIFLLIFNFGQYFKFKSYEQDIFYRFEAVPNLDLKNSLVNIQGTYFGEITGFVKFLDISQQPKNARQYYIIKPQNNLNTGKTDYFILEEIISLGYLPPSSVGTDELRIVSDTQESLILEDLNKNQYIYNKSSKKLYLFGGDGDKTEFITDNNEYKNFIKQLLKR